MSHDKSKKELVLISARIEKTFERLEKFCEDLGLGKMVTLERALNMYMDEYYGKPEYQIYHDVENKTYILLTNFYNIKHIEQVVC